MLIIQWNMRQDLGGFAIMNINGVVRQAYVIFYA